MAAGRSKPWRQARAALSFWFVLFLPASPALSAENRPLPFSISSGRLFSVEGREIVFSKLTLAADSASYQRPGEGRPRLIPASAVLRVDQQSGNESLKWGAGMAAAGLLGSLLGLASAGNTSDGGTVSSGTKTALAVGSTAVFGVIGLALGAGHRTYTTVYENPSFKRP